MSLSIERFDEFFRTLWGYDPFLWQSRLARQVVDRGESWPDCIDLPTASGKTTCIDIAVFALACQAGLETKDRTVGRRIFFTVNRRVVVDEAFDRSFTLAKQLSSAKYGILKDVADALREVGGDQKAPPLDVARLRGGVYRDRAWARSITQPMVVCTTADQLGSRLLFRGYGVSASSAPIHAALCGCDSLVMLDEAHVTRAFSQTLRLLTRYQAQHATAPKMRFVQMTATPAGEIPENKRFTLKDENWSDPRNRKLRDRRHASKPAELVKLEKKKSIVGEIVDRAVEAASGSPKAVGIIVNRVQTAREIERLIRDEIDKRTKSDEAFSAAVHLVIGRMRPIDRGDLQEELRSLVGPGRPEILTKNVFVVATQCLEVGADYDFDVLLTECAALDALRQRFGRLNRQGRPIEATATIVTNEESIKGDDPVYGDAIKNTWEWLWSKKNENKQVDFGIVAFKPLWEEVEKERATFLDDNCSTPLLSPTQNAAVLLPAHLDALCQTDPPAMPSPDVGYFIHGPQRDNSEVNVCWRADLGPDDDSAQHRWPEIVRLLPPTSSECMSVPLITVKRWLGEKFKTDADADVAIAVPEQVDEKPSKRQFPLSMRLVAWRGAKDCQVIETSAEIRPNDTIVVRTQDFGWESLGHIPGAPSHTAWEESCARTDEAGIKARTEIELRRDRVDQAERATRQKRLRVVVRLHPIFPGRAELRGRNKDEVLGSLIGEESDGDPELGDRIKAILRSKVDTYVYPGEQNESPESQPNLVLVFKNLLPPKDKLPVDDDDGEDALSEGNRFISLDEHTRHVVERLNIALSRLHLGKLELSVRASASLHDIGKTDARFQAMLAGVTPSEAMMLPNPLGKGDGVRRTTTERNAIFERARYPRGFRHEMLSVELAEHLKLEVDLPHRDLLLHLIAAHHGYARPFAPVCIDDSVDDDLRSLNINGGEITGIERKAWTPSHRLDSGVAERFWALTREHGWWGLCWLEAILRLADQQASAAEQGHIALHGDSR